MYIIPLGWLYVALMMAISEATSSQGTVLGAVITFLLYGVLPVSILVYVMGTPLRRKERARQEALEQNQTASEDAPSAEPDASGHASGAADIAATPSAVTTVRKET
jgi:hypothetical protein